MAKHVHIHFAPRKRIGDQAPGSVPPSDLKPLVEALHAAIAARQGATPTQDADFDESKVKRDEGGRFSAQQHEAAAAEHKAEAEKHDAAYKATNDPQHALARNAHQEAGVHHGVAAKHVQAQTGWSDHNAQQAHNATALAKQMSAKTAGSGNLEQLKATASDPSASIEQRAAAVAQLSKMEKLANTVAESPHAVPVPGTASDPEMQALAAKNPALARQIEEHNQRGRVFRTDPNHPSQQMKPGPGGEPNAAQPAAGGAAPQAQPAGDKPTSAKASGAKAATHELLSSGHPFSVDELMKATGCSNRTTLMTALSDLKSPKYAGKLGALNIVKRPDGMYHVQKDDGKALGKVSADNPYGLDDSTRAGLAKLAPKIAAQQGAPTDKNAGPTKGSTLGPDMPGSAIPPRKMDFNQQGEQNLAPSIAGKKDEGSGTRMPNAPHYGGSTTGVKFGPVSKVGGVMSGLGPAGTDEAAAAGKDLASKGFEPYHAGSYGSAQEAVHAYKHPKTGEMVHVAKNHATGAVEVRPATQVHRAGPGGGAALPMQTAEGGFSRNPVQNVQARMDAKAAAPKKSIWGTPKSTLKPKDLQIRSGQNTDPNMAVKSAAGPSAPGTKTREQITHHQNMEAKHRAEADKIRASGIGNYKDHLRAAQMHANAANDYANGKGKGGWTPVSAGSANALSKNMGLDPLNTSSKPNAGTPTSAYSPDQAVKDLHGKQFGPIQVSARVHSQTGELMADWDHTFRRNTRVGEYKEQQQHIDRANAHLAGVAKKLGATYKPYTIEDAKRSDERAQQNEGSAYSEYEQSMGSGFKHAKAGAPAPSPAAAPSPAPSPQSTSSSTFWKNAYKKLGQNSRR